MTAFNQAVAAINRQLSAEGAAAASNKLEAEKLAASKLSDDEVYEVRLIISQHGYFLRDDTGKEQLYTDVNRLCTYLRAMHQSALPTARQEKLCREIPQFDKITFGPAPKRRGAPLPKQTITLEELGL